MPPQRTTWSFQIALLVVAVGCFPLAAAAGAQTPGEALDGGAYREAIPGTVVDFEMIPVPAGTVTMNGPNGPEEVTVGPYWIGATEVTWDLYDIFVFGTGGGTAAAGEEGVSRPSRPYMLPGESFGHSGNPALGMSFLAAERFADWLAERTGRRYRLPTEAEWEYACRAGGEPITELAAHAWYAANSQRRTHRVGTLAPNAFGIHDVLGNTGEWVTTEGVPVVKGGAYRDTAADVTCSTRREWDLSWQITDPQLPRSRWWFSDGTFVGLRIVREP